MNPELITVGDPDDSSKPDMHRERWHSETCVLFWNQLYALCAKLITFFLVIDWIWQVSKLHLNSVCSPHRLQLVRQCYVFGFATIKNSNLTQLPISMVFAWTKLCCYVPTSCNIPESLGKKRNRKQKEKRNGEGKATCESVWRWGLLWPMSGVKGHLLPVWTLIAVCRQTWTDEYLCGCAEDIKASQ